MFLIPKTAARVALGATAAIGLAMLVPTGPVQAQDYEQTTAGGDVTVTAPRVQRDPATGADIETVMTTRIVSYADLDLNTGYGRRVLRERVVHAAFQACDGLDMRYVTLDSTADCMRTAVRHALAQSPVGPEAYNEY